MYDYSELLGKIKSKNLTQIEYGKLIGLSETSVSGRLNNKLAFKQEEIEKSCKVLDIPFSEIEKFFFTKQL